MIAAAPSHTPAPGLIRGLATLVAALVVCAPAQALSLADCDRTTHPSHGGDEAHVNYGNGKVGWIAWWSQEGVSKTVWLADCATGDALSLRTHEERITDRFVADQTAKARDMLARWAATAGPFLTPANMADKIAHLGTDLSVMRHGAEFCGCHAAYPDLRGDKTAFEVTR